ncbi:MAG: hypothetical protein ACRD29_07365 [Acidimicrobiales bacterium]
MAVEEVGWETAAAEADRYEVIIVNGGDPSAAEFDALVAAADAGETSLVFTGTWGVRHGGIRLLERFGAGDVAVGDQGYGDGAVGLEGYDPSHPLFAGLENPSAVLEPDGYWSDIASYVGPYLAELVVERHDGELGTAAAYDFRTARSLHLLLSTSAVTGLIGPGYGWTADAERLMLNAVAWARTAEQVAPAVPTLTTDADPIVTTPTITVTGTAEFRSTVTVFRGGVEVGTATPGRDGAFAVDVPLVEGPNVLMARATNFAGVSPASNDVTVTLDTTGPEVVWTPRDSDGFFDPHVTVRGTAVDAYAGATDVEVNGRGVALGADGRFRRRVPLALGENVITVTATDALGNETTEARTVRLFPYDAAWQVAGGGAALNVFLRITDDAGRSIRVDRVTLEVRDAGGHVVLTLAMRWDAHARRYRATVRDLPPGVYSLRGILDVDGWRVISNAGPTPG